MIIAEIGQNFCGDLRLARNLIQLAKENGAYKVKFQLYDHQTLYRNHPEISDSSLSLGQARDLFNFGQDEGIEVFFSVFDIERVKWCEDIGVKTYKIAYSMHDKEVLKAVRATGKPIYISRDWDYRPESSNEIPFYCVPKYPAEIKDLNLHRNFIGNTKGYSDHFVGLEMCKFALYKRASYIEKHFALDHQTGVDAKWSMMPSELKELKEWENRCLGIG